MIEELTHVPKIWLTLEDCEQLFKSFKKNLEFQEPIPPFETRYPNRLESILDTVSQTFEGHNLYPTVKEAASAYLNLFIRSQAFMNGNKRMGVLFTHFFLFENGIDFSLTPNELFTLAAFVSSASEKGIDTKKTQGLCERIICEFTVKRSS